MIILTCTKCGKDVERSIMINDAACFQCRKKRKDEYNRKYMSFQFIPPKSKQIIRKQEKKCRHCDQKLEGKRQFYCSDLCSRKYTYCYV